MAASVEQTVVAKLKATAAVNDAVGGRIFAVLDTQEAEVPAIIIQKLGAEGDATLDGGASLKRYRIQVDVYGETEIQAEAIGTSVRNAIAPGRPASPWVDAAAGVQGAFFEDTSGEFTEDGFRLQSEVFGVWWQPVV